MQDTWVWFLGREDPLEKEMATHSNILAWRIPWIEGPGRVRSMGSQESDTTKQLNYHHRNLSGLPRWYSSKEPVCQCRRHRKGSFDPWVGKIPMKKAWQPTPVFLPGKFHGQRSLVGYSPWDHKGSDMTEWLTYTHIPSLFPTSISAVVSLIHSINRFIQIRQHTFTAHLLLSCAPCQALGRAVNETNLPFAFLKPGI